jgi:integrase
MRWAQDHGYHTNEAYQEFTVKVKAKNDIVTLTEDELLAIYSLDLSNNQRLDRVRDLFCFGCFTGQRWSDIDAFRKEQIKGDNWDFISMKTKSRIIIPLKGFAAPALDILEKYDYKLPQISGQKFNEYIKEVAVKAELKSDVLIKRFSGNKEIEIRKPKSEFVSSHMARRTFVTILLQRGVPATTIMKLTGHKDLRTLLKYENTSLESAVAALESVGPMGKQVIMKVS